MQQHNGSNLMDTLSSNESRLNNSPHFQNNNQGMSSQESQKHQHEFTASNQTAQFNDGQLDVSFKPGSLITIKQIPALGRNAAVFSLPPLDSMSQSASSEVSNLILMMRA